MFAVKLVFWASVIFAAYVLIDVIIPLIGGRTPFTMIRYIFKGKDHGEEVKEYNDSQKDSKE